MNMRRPVAIIVAQKIDRSCNLVGPSYRKLVSSVSRPLPVQIRVSLPGRKLPDRTHGRPCGFERAAPQCVQSNGRRVRPFALAEVAGSVNVGSPSSHHERPLPSNERNLT